MTTLPLDDTLVQVLETKLGSLLQAQRSVPRPQRTGRKSPESCER